MSEELVVRVAEAGADPIRLDELATLLRRELDGLDTLSTQPLIEPPPAGTRAVDAIAIGAFLVSVKGPLQAMLALIRTWLARGPSTRTVEIALGENSLKVGGVSKQQQEQLIEQFLAAVRHE